MHLMLSNTGKEAADESWSQQWVWNTLLAKISWSKLDWVIWVKRRGRSGSLKRGSQIQTSTNISQNAWMPGGCNRDRGLTVVNPYLPDFTAPSALVTWMDAHLPTWEGLGDSPSYIYMQLLALTLWSYLNLALTHFVLIEVILEGKFLAKENWKSPAVYFLLRCQNWRQS